MYKFLQIRKSISMAAFIVMLSILSSVAAHASITASTGSATFTNQQIGTVSAPMPVTVTNTSWRETTIDSVLLSSTEFSYSGPSLPLTLEPGGSAVFNITFSPDGGGNVVRLAHIHKNLWLADICRPEWDSYRGTAGRRDVLTQSQLYVHPQSQLYVSGLRQRQSVRWHDSGRDTH